MKSPSQHNRTEKLLESHEYGCPTFNYVNVCGEVSKDFALWNSGLCYDSFLS